MAKRTATASWNGKIAGRVPGIDAEEFSRHADAAKAGCPASKALRGVGDVILDARLEG